MADAFDNITAAAKEAETAERKLQFAQSAAVIGEFVAALESEGFERGEAISLARPVVTAICTPQQDYSGLEAAGRAILQELARLSGEAEGE